ncbi:MAG: sugar phosphate isomerase/epimerase [Limnochordales bacterium]|nr:sugar phosphate isomerase/epimerase [Limnochordales bacterium]
MKILMHSYTYRRYPLERALKKAAELGYDGIELSTVHLPPQDPLAGIPAAVEQAAKLGAPVRVLSFGADLTHKDENVRQQSLERAVGFIRTAGRLGIPLVNGGVANLVGPRWDRWGENGSKLATDEHYRLIAQGLRVLDQAASEAGVRVALEIHPNSVHDTAASTLRILEESGAQNIVANLDAGNMYGTPHAEEATQAIAMLSKHLGYVHLKNCRRLPGAESADYSWTLEMGHLDYYRILEALYRTGYSGFLTIEYCGQGDPSVAAAADIRYVRQILAEIAATGASS